MRSRASGLGARMSSRVLLIVRGHRTHHRIDERSLLGAQTILPVELAIRPHTTHCNIGDESEPLTIEVMSIGAQRDEEPDELRPKVSGEVGRLGLCLESIGYQIGFRTCRTRWKHTDAN